MTLAGADLSEAILVGADLSEANLDGADLRGAVFEPTANPVPSTTALTENLELVTYETNSGPLTELRQAFKDGGFRQAERQVTYALKKREAEIRLTPCVGEDGGISFGKTIAAGGCLRYLGSRVFFDLTSQYGMSPNLPLIEMAILGGVFSFVYAVFIHIPGRSGLYLVGKRVWKGKEQSRELRIVPRPVRSRRWWLSPFSRLRGEWRVFRAAMMFSFMSAFNIGFREINFGRWIRLLMKREYDLRPVGWVRTISGVQALISVYLVALWVLTTFGRPFE